MYYQQTAYHQAPKQDPRLSKLRQDNVELEKALKDLNQCYQEKIAILEQQLKQSKQKEQTLLEWKSSYIDKELFNNSKYEQELQKLVTMMETMTQNYQNDQDQFKTTLNQNDQQIAHLKDENVHLREENTFLRHQKDSQELQISTLAQKYIVEIERLNNELKELKDEVNYDDLTDKEPEEFDRQSEELIFKDSLETPFEDPSLQQESADHSIIDQNFTEVDEPTLSTVKEQNPLKDISNKNPTTSTRIEKSTYLNGAITIQSHLGH